MRRTLLATIAAAFCLLACDAVDHGAWSEGDPPLPGADEAPASQRCGAAADWVDVAAGVGVDGFDADFVTRHAAATGSLHWDVFDGPDGAPAEVGNRRWCSGTLIGPGMLITAGHCLEPLGVAGLLSVDDMCRHLHVDFDYQRGPGADGPGSVAGVTVTDGHGGRPVGCAGVLEYRLDEAADHAILQLDELPFEGLAPVSLGADVSPGDVLFLAHHPLGLPKVAGAGTVHADSDARWLRYADLDTDRGSSGAGVLDAQGRLVGVHIGGRCAENGGTNRALSVAALALVSDLIAERVVNAGCVDGDGDGAVVGAGCDPIDCDDDSPERHPGATEVCNGLDDDCDGRVDEGALNRCGACGAVPEEVCNGIDDDCDGGMDEGLLNRCGACGSVPEEACNGIDDDCDGAVDEGLLNRCGACGPVPEEACNGIDDDCDGASDEGIGCAPDVHPVPPIPFYDEDYPGAPAGDGTDYQPPSGTVPLYSWFSPGRGDNLLTTDPRYAGRAGDERPPDYSFSRVEGMIFDPSRPQPPGTVPLVSWYSPSRSDNFASTRRGGAIGDRSPPDYELYRIEGYVFDSPVAGTVPLVSWYSDQRGDNYATTHPLWAGAVGDVRQPDYRMYRVQGYVFPAPPSVRDAARFGYGSRSVSGEVPLLVIHQDMRDFPAERDVAWFEEMIFGEVRGPHPSTVALHGWWNPGARDNRVSSDPAWAGHPASEQHPAYGFSRLEGHLFEPESAPPGTVALYGWYSHHRTDHRITSDLGWAGPIGAHLESYACGRFEGRAFDPGLPQPPGTTPLWSWYNDEREDYFTTTHGAWNPEGGPRGGYNFVRLEGYVLPPDAEMAGTRPLYGWYDRFRFDNHVTTSAAWAGEAASVRDGYHYVANDVRVFDPDLPQPPGTVPLNTWSRAGSTYSTTLADFADGRPAGFDFERLEGYLYAPDGPRPPGAVPVYLYHSADTGDFLLSASPAYSTAPPTGYARLSLEGYAIPARPPHELNVVSFYDALSGGRFGFTRGGLVRLRFPRGVEDEDFADHTWLLEAAAEHGVDFGAFDADADGVIERSELIIVVATAGWGAGVGGQTQYTHDQSVGRLRFANGFPICLVDARADLNTFAHELFHGVGQGIDIYGPVEFPLNGRASLMAGSFDHATSPGPLWLDPFHAFRAGWSEPPRLVAVDDVAGSAVVRPGAPPLVFFDGRRSPSDFLVLEHRDPAARSYDAGTLPGVLAWTVHTVGDFVLEQFRWVPCEGDCMAASAYISGPRGPGVQPPWRPDDGAFRLQWHDGTDVGLEFEVVRLAEGGAVVRWQPAQGFVPRLDGAVYDRDEGLMTISGVLPEDADLVLIDGVQTQILRRLSNRFVVFPGRGFEPGQQPIVVRYRGHDSNPLLTVDVIGGGR